MDFKTFWRSLKADEKARLAKDANTDASYLSQVAHGHRNAGADLIERLMAADPRISFEMMRSNAA